MTAWREETSGLCPECRRAVPAVLEARDDQIWLRGVCPRHGASEALVASDAAEYLRLRRYVSPRVGGGCCGGGEDCGPGAASPVCVLLLEITQACNLRCPTCFADAHGHDFLTVDTARRRLDTFFQSHRHLDVLMLSGGEPTIHPEFEAMLDMALAAPVDRVLVNTNGLRLVQSPRLREILAARRDRIELYLSFGSFRPEVHQRLYGRDLVREKTEAVRFAAEAGLLVNLVPTIEAGVNDDEIGDLYRYALGQPGVNGIVFQPAMNSGRYEHAYDPASRATLTGVLRALEAQTGGDLRSADFVALPCSHPDCCALTYGIRSRDRTHLTPIPRHLDVGRYLDLFSDRISFTGLAAGAARRLWSDVASLRAGRSLRDLALLAREAGLAELLPLRGDRRAMAERIFRVVVKPFMDASTFDQRRIDQCCTRIVDENGAAVSFCEYNTLRRGAAARPGRTALPVVG